MSYRHAPLAHAAPDTVFAPAAIEVIDLRKSFGKTAVLNGLTLRVESGERVALIGPNGAGKSTLFDLISGRFAPTSGEVWVEGRRVDGKRPDAISRAGLARGFQVSNVFHNLSVEDNLRCAVLASLGDAGVFWRSLSRMRRVNERVMPLLEALGLAPRRRERAGDLGYADQRALELGITLASDPSVLLLDEPTAGRSQSEAEAFVRLIHDMTDGRSLLMVEHDMNVVFSVADRIAVLVQGSLLAFDTPEKIKANPRVRAAYLGKWPGAAPGAADPEDGDGVR